jgi:hypothetical protein
VGAGSTGARFRPRVGRLRALRLNFVAPDRSQGGVRARSRSSTMSLLPAHRITTRVLAITRAWLENLLRA